MVTSLYIGTKSKLRTVTCISREFGNDFRVLWGSSLSLLKALFLLVMEETTGNIEERDNMPMIWLTKDIKIWQISSTWINGLMPISVYFLVLR